MNSRKKKILFILAGVSAASLLAALFLVLTFDINSYKKQIESAASEATGMKVSVNGKLSLSLFPGVGVTFEDILMQKYGADAASVDKAEVELKLLPLVRRKILVKQVKLFNPGSSSSKTFKDASTSKKFRISPPAKSPTPGHSRLKKSQSGMRGYITWTKKQASEARRTIAALS